MRPHLRASGGGIELAVTRAVDKAFPLMPVKYKYSLVRIARYPHQDPLSVARGSRRGGGGSRLGGGVREGYLDRAVARPGALPGLRGEVYAQLGDRWLGGHGFLATPQ
jgi:hypothetical protein